ncbi:reverse transcriptase domain-containing protein [Tanacetum coccineum]
MRTRNSYFPNNSNVIIPRRLNKGRAPNIVEPELRTIVAPMAERTMEELLRAPTEGYGEAIVLPEINADHFEIKTNLLQLVQANPFYGRESENPHAHINSFKRITSTLRFRNVPNDDLVTKFVNQFFPPSKTTHLKNEISRFTQKFEETFSEAWERFKELLRACPHHGFTELTQVDTFYNGLNENEQDSLNAAAGGNLLSKTTREALNIIENKSKVRYSRNRSNASRMNATSSKTDERIDKLADQLSNRYQSTVSKKLSLPLWLKRLRKLTLLVVVPIPGIIVRLPITIRLVFMQPRGEMKAITTRSGVAYEGPSIPTNPSPKKVVERETEEKTDKEQTNFQGSTAQIPSLVIPISIPEHDVPKTLPKTTPIPESDIPKSLPKPNIPYPSRRDDQKSHDKASNQMEKIFQIFQDLCFDKLVRGSYTFDARLILAMLLKKLHEKLRDPGKFLIPCNFRRDWMYGHALAIWRLADRSITYPKGLAEDVFVKVGKFHFPTDFVVVDFKVDPRVPLILGRSFLRTGRALIDVYEGELILSDGNEQIIFHVDGMSKHPQKHVNESIKMVNDTCKDSFKRFIDEPALVYSPPSEDDNDEKEKQEVKNLAEPTAKRQSRITPCLKNFISYLQGEHFHSNKTPQVSSVFAITSTLPSIEPKDSLIMGDEHLSIFSVEEIVPIPRESEDTSRSDSKNVLPSCDDFSSINVPRDDLVTFFNPLFEFDVNFNSSDINPLFDKVMSGGDDIEFLLHHDPSTPMKSIASILEGFIDDPPFEENDDLFDLECKTNDWKRILYDAPIDEAECFDLGGDNDEIDAFLSIEVPTYIEEGYYDSEGDVIYLESLISNEPQHDTFSPKSDPLHHEFTGKLITIPPGIVKEHEDYINRMSLLCGNSSSRSSENSHTIIESLPTSTTLVEDSDSNREEIDIFSRLDDSISLGIESDFDSKEDIIDNLLNNDPIPEYERLTFIMEPNVLIINNVNEDECFDPGGGEINVEVDDSFTFVT